MRKISAYEVALSALACALATIVLTVGLYTEILLFTGYMLASVFLLLPLAKKSYLGYVLAYIATCVLAVIFGSSRFWDLLPFILFFGLHPIANELQLKSKLPRWLGIGIKAVWFDGTLLLVWRFVMDMTTSISIVDKYILPFILVFGSLFFVFYDFVFYRWRYTVNTLISRIIKK